MTTTSRRRLPGSVAALAGTTALLLAASGCGALGGGQADESSQPVAATTTQTTTESPEPGSDLDATATTGTETATADPTSAATSGPTAISTDPGTAAPTGNEPAPAAATDGLGTPVVSRSAGQDGSTIRVDVFAIRRSGSTSTLTLRATMVKTKNNNATANLGTILSDADHSKADSTGFAPDGLQLIDTVRKQAYLVGSDGAGACVCTPRNLLNTDLGSGQSVLVTATFAAPPQGVTAMSVQIPHFGTVPSVPVR